MATNENVMARVYETLLCSPGMSEQVKVDVKINRSAVLLLHHIVEQGLLVKEGETAGLLKLLPQEILVELRSFNDECLKKAGLTELNEKLKQLN